MFHDYVCPKCNGHLRINDEVILTARTDKWQGGLLVLHPELGNYSFENHPSFKFEEGARVDLLCPICHADLSSDKHENLAMVIMREESGEEYTIYFSKVVGEQSTFKMLGEHVEVYGKHAENYIDFFSLSRLI